MRQRSESHQHEVERDLVNEAWYFQTEVHPNQALPRLLSGLHEEFGLHPDVPDEQQQRLEAFSRADFERFCRRVMAMTGCRPVCVLFDTVSRTYAMGSGAYLSPQELQSLASILRVLARQFWALWPRDPGARLERQLAERGKAILGHDIDLTKLSERWGGFTSTYRSFGEAFCAVMHGPAVSRRAVYPRLASAFFLFHEFDLNPAFILRQAKTPVHKGMRRSLGWDEPAAVPRFERHDGAQLYVEALRINATQRALVRRYGSHHPGKIPVIRARLAGSRAEPEEAKLVPWLECALGAWLLAGTWVACWLGHRGVPETLSVRRRLAWGFVLALFPALVGAVLFLGGWLFMRDRLQPLRAMSAVDQQFDRLDAEIAHQIDEKSRWAQSLRWVLPSLDTCSPSEGQAKLTGWLGTSTFDLAFLQFRSGREYLWFPARLRGDPSVIKLFQILMRDFFQTRAGEGESRPDQLLTKAITEQFVDTKNLARWLERGESVQRSPAGSLNQV
ncbi:MAG TPA: hypothetical protein PKO06_21230, partial [Candidatus Ozemobacteraceae bacterium]|nr:hypothetical protein [Candidatus Ozemobacteraceae bacterium]